MNLRNGQITIGEILANPKARAVIEQELPMLIHNPLLNNAHALTLAYVKNMGRNYIPLEQMNRIIRKLEEC